MYFFFFLPLRTTVRTDRHTAVSYRETILAPRVFRLSETRYNFIPWRGGKGRQEGMRIYATCIFSPVFRETSGPEEAKRRQYSETLKSVYSWSIIYGRHYLYARLIHPDLDTRMSNAIVPIAS